jgi:hypothetical protein
MCNFINFIIGFCLGIIVTALVFAAHTREHSIIINSLIEQNNLLKEINQQQKEVIRTYENRRFSETVVSEETINFTYRGGTLE